MKSNLRRIYIAKYRPKIYKVHQILLEVDDFPLLPSNLASSFLTLIRRIKHLRLLKTNKEYAKLNKVKRAKSGEYKPFSDLLTLYHKLEPESRIEKALRKITSLQPSLCTRALLDLFDLLFKGYKESQVWDLDYDIADRVGRQLLELSTIIHGWPDSDEFPKFEDWKSALELHGKNLIKYSNRDKYLMSLYLKANTKELTPEEKKRYKKEHDMLEREIFKNAKAAFTFISKHHSNLWD